VDHALLVRVLDGRADLLREVEPRRERQPVLAAVRRDRRADDQLHHEERPAAVGDACVEHPRDVRVLHHLEHLALDFESFGRPPARRVRLQDLDRDAPPDRRGLVRLEHDAAAAAALAQPSDESVRPDRRAGLELFLVARPGGVGVDPLEFGDAFVDRQDRLRPRRRGAPLDPFRVVVPHAVPSLAALARRRRSVSSPSVSGRRKPRSGFEGTRCGLIRLTRAREAWETAPK
jgi:hypothetical protein